MLAWEAGDGRNHIATLKTVAENIGDRFSFDAALCRITHQAELAAFCDAVVKGPWLPHSNEYRKAQGNPDTATWGEFMGDIGFRRPEILRKSIGWWQQTMRDRNISLVIADCAPCALLAARGLGIPSVAVGTGYLVPPANMETFPVLLPRHATRIYDEAEIVDTINSVVPEFGVPELNWLPEVYASTDQLVFTLDMLDPYAAWRSEPLLPPIMGGTPQPAPGGQEIFVYFSTTEKSDPGLMEGIGNLGVPVRLFMPGMDDAMAEDFTRRGVSVERLPLPVDLIARRTRLMVNAAQHGTLCIGLAAGLPQVCVPQQLEHQYTAEAAAGRGSLKVVDKQNRGAERFRSIVLDAYEDAGLARRARDLAEELRPQFQANQRKWIRRRLSDVMAGRA
ncbi:glycosyltransferase family 1 protein [Mesorhizobium sp. YM1C-6-2]|uniref:glycosyltransferase n=1 Tax=Mesorhizobium sp. YM1C-6-2 TaxID=1827501 RepID=UPI0011C374C6|nr:glycosyltransferase family 1 protein [Mesorhizobium sp. YM1C-6-2]